MKMMVVVLIHILIVLHNILEQEVVVPVLLDIQEIIQNQHPPEELVVLVEQMYMHMVLEIQ